MSEKETERCANKERFLTDCPNMKGVDGDTDMSGDNYECKVCGQRVWLDYEDMK